MARSQVLDNVGMYFAALSLIVMTPRSRHQFVAARFSDQDGRSGGILLDLLP